MGFTSPPELVVDQGACSDPHPIHGKNQCLRNCLCAWNASIRALSSSGATAEFTTISYLPPQAQIAQQVVSEQSPPPKKYNTAGPSKHTAASTRTRRTHMSRAHCAGGRKFYLPQDEPVSYILPDELTVCTPHA